VCVTWHRHRRARAWQFRRCEPLGTSSAEPVYELKGLDPTMESRMKAPFLKLGLISVSIVLLPGLASAKGPGLDHVTLDGPGIDEPLLIEEQYPYLLDDAIGMHIFGSTTRTNTAREGPNRAHLGPQFQLRYHMIFGEPIEIAFYPYADQAPVAYARSGQAAIVPVGRSRDDVKFPVHPGWYDYRPAMVDLLQEEGLPTADEIDQSFPVTTVFTLAGASLVAALAFAATTWRRRRLQVTVDTSG
jgi:hypothetical protein